MTMTLEEMQQKVADAVSDLNEKKKAWQEAATDTSHLTEKRDEEVHALRSQMNDEIDRIRADYTGKINEVRDHYADQIEGIESESTDALVEYRNAIKQCVSERLMTRDALGQLGHSMPRLPRKRRRPRKGFQEDAQQAQAETTDGAEDSDTDFNDDQQQ